MNIASMSASVLSSVILKWFSPFSNFKVPTLLHIGPMSGECHMLFIGVAEAMYEWSLMLTLQKMLSSAAFEKFSTGVRAWIHNGISPSTSLLMMIPSANVSSTFRNPGSGPFLTCSSSSSVHTDAAIPGV